MFATAAHTYILVDEDDRNVVTAGETLEGLLNVGDA